MRSSVPRLGGSAGRSAKNAELIEAVTRTGGKTAFGPELALQLSLAPLLATERRSRVLYRHNSVLLPISEDAARSSRMLNHNIIQINHHPLMPLLQLFSPSFFAW